MICFCFIVGLLENDSNLILFFIVMLNRKRGKLKNCVFIYLRSFELFFILMLIFFFLFVLVGIKRLFMFLVLLFLLLFVLKIEKFLMFDVDRGVVEDLVVVSSFFFILLFLCWLFLLLEFVNKFIFFIIFCWVFVFFVDFFF